jgi:hypothetical protein
MKKLFVLMTGLLFVSVTAWADTLELVNGKILEGTFVDRSDGNVRFEVDGVTTIYTEQDVKNISFGTSEAKTSQADASAQQSAAADTSTSVTVPAGTQLMVRTKEALDTSRHKSGHKFTAALEADLAVNGTVVAPRGSNVYGELVSAKQAGRLAGKSEMTISFTGLMINNQIKPIRTGAVQAVAESGQGKDTAGKVARGAAIGAMIDGKDGARKGAKVGAGAAILSRGGRINIPPGTLLEVPLAEPFTL